MRHYPPPSGISYSFGPGPVTPTIKALIWANVALFAAAALLPELIGVLGLRPEDVVGRMRLWQPVTYLFLHSGLFHILFNMLALWMFGVELERMWGTRSFLKYYFVTGIGAGLVTVLLAFLPLPGSIGDTLRYSVTVGASGAIYGLLLAYALRFPNRPLFMFPIPIPIPAKYFVLILGGIALLSSVAANQGGVANVAHLGGLAVGYLYLRGRRAGPPGGIKYRYTKWRMNRVRRKFDVYAGGRRDWDRHVH